MVLKQIYTKKENGNGNTKFIDSSYIMYNGNQEIPMFTIFFRDKNLKLIPTYLFYNV